MAILILAAAFGLSATAQDRRVAVTFDDLPASGSVGCDREVVLGITEALLASVQAHDVPAIGFANAGRPCPELVEEVLTLWLDRGMDLGNHTATHPDINRVSLDVYFQDVLDGERILRNLVEERGRRLRYFRHPYLRAGDTPEKKAGLEAFLNGHGYTVAPVTIDSGEWIFARAYARARRGGAESQTLARIESTYLNWLDAVVAHFEEWSVDVLGYELPQILLLHANELNAATFDSIAELLVRRGYRFVSLEEALEDPAYAQPDPYVGRYGNSWLHRWARGRGMEVRWEPDAPAWIVEFGE